MSVEEIEQAIFALTPDELDRIERCISVARRHEDDSGRHARPTLAEAMGPLLGGIGQASETGPQSSSRNAGAALTQELVAKKRRGRL